ncbi:nuclear transport factor 2 family protein [Pseudomonas syringae]|uniref:nuclear transport factor 2 family protein n=1 Tax=Pseudomonas syringae TaxID=317 RepID=UPI003F835255
MPHHKYFVAHDLLCRFFAAFVNRDWIGMRSVLAPEIFVDYSSSGRETAREIAAEEFVNARANAEDGLTKQHNFSNLLVVESTAEKLVVSCHYLILPFDLLSTDQQTNFYHSCGEYVFGFAPFERQYRIASIKQVMLQSWGDARLHGAIKKQ